MQPIIFNFPQYQNLANAVANKLQFQQGKLETRHYPEGESYVRLLCDVKDREGIDFDFENNFNVLRTLNARSALIPDISSWPAKYIKISSNTDKRTTKASI